MPRRIPHILIALTFVFSLALAPWSASAQSNLTVQVSTSASCDVVTFTLQVQDAAGDYEATFDFGDGETSLENFTGASLEIEHTYPTSDSYSWMVEVRSLNDSLSGLTSGSVQVGPEVSLTSDPFPPVLTLDGGSALLSASAEVTNAEAPVTYLWDLDGDSNMDDGASENDASASFEYKQAGKYTASVEISDSCGLAASDSLPVVVFDPEDACHPRAQDIAQAVSTLFPDKSEDTYSCEDIFGIFNGDLTGDQLGFGRMWHAYQLATSLEELTWQEVLDWHLEQGGWGLLTQLDRYADALAEVGLRDLTQMVITGEASIQEIRIATRSVVRFEADFEDALTRLQEGASPGELQQFYRTSSDLEMDPAALEAYLESGLTLPEVKHLGSLATRFDMDLDGLAAARQEGASWGELNQANRLADDETSMAEILTMGVKDYRESLRVQDRQQRELERTERTASQLTEQYGVELTEVQAMYETCAQDWQCVRQQLREQERQNGQADRDARTAERLASQYSVSLSQVWSLFNGECDGDWNCVRKTLRENYLPQRGNNGNN